MNPNHIGDAEKALRLRHLAEFDALPDADRQFWFDQALRNAGLDPAVEQPSGVCDLLTDVAATVYAEMRDQNEARRIRSLAAYTTEHAAAGIAPQGGF